GWRSCRATSRLHCVNTDGCACREPGAACSRPARAAKKCHNETATPDQREFWFDNRQYTVMSHFGGYDTSARTTAGRSSPPAAAATSPRRLLLDIDAVQFLYGANMSTRTGDTV